MPAFERAIEIGVDALEMDVHLTRDGQLDRRARRHRAAHDRRRRCAWRELDLADAQRLDAGWGFVAQDGTRPFAGQGHQRRRRSRTCSTRSRRCTSTSTSRATRAVDADARAAARKLDAEDRVTLASFQTTTARRGAPRGYGGETALSQGEVATLLALPAVLWRQLPFTGTAAQVPTHQGPLRFDRAPFIAKCHSARPARRLLDDRRSARSARACSSSAPTAS